MHPPRLPEALAHEPPLNGDPGCLMLDGTPLALLDERMGDAPQLERRGLLAARGAEELRDERYSNTMLSPSVKFDVEVGFWSRYQH
ncbi:MAG: hypothetical protein GY711_20355 [bacterium]|nr:hypothetical protein [bacterium]